MSWRFLNASVRGTSHERGDVPCQDDCYADVLVHDSRELLLAIASDGAGSASCAEQGAGLVCETLLHSAEQWLRGGGTVGELHRDEAQQWIERARTAIERRAAEQERTPRDFACTLAAALVDADAAAFLQIGDGAIVAGSHDSYEVIFWPDGGEYANTTFFTTDDDWAEHLHFDVRSVAFDSIAVLTDGLQRLALAFESRSAHAPFFAPMFVALRNAAPGFASELESPLVSFLGSEAVNARTDDDKSLVLATRACGVVDGVV